MTSTHATDSWTQQPNEPTIWFGRFEVYRQLGPTRSLWHAYQQERQHAGKPIGRNTPGSWERIAAQWRWKARAAAWDAEQLRILLAKPSTGLLTLCEN
jgi:hypothetical protein